MVAFDRGAFHAKGGYTYILSNTHRTVLYIGVTSYLERRSYEHQNTGLHKLVYYECHKRIEDAIAHEKQLKGKTRVKEAAIINLQNRDWHDLDPSLRAW